MTANLNLLGMPPEIRFAIYNAYVAIDYALQLTCKQIAHEIAHEMRGLALRRNTTTMFLYMVFVINKLKRNGAPDVTPDAEGNGDAANDDTDNDTDSDSDALYYTQDIVEEVVKEFPQLERVFQAINKYPKDIGEISLNVANDFGIAPSVFWDPENAYALSEEFPTRSDFLRFVTTGSNPPSATWLPLLDKAPYRRTWASASTRRANTNFLLHLLLYDIDLVIVQSIYGRK
ncbi:hypothetical protein C2857_006828 [Epichloe festucae Fl1]|uniref:Uncharacterized protein n=1 Tax=Epichloe festucae (strain Fl1) TaxID=877507 RepID=A0A7S9KQA6_EPIFF|nr:hypothetical protein C2857_006828 [Epichloe festucae Fl1]